ncbi:MAG: D-alanyl-D-alanine carboxypeptidase [Verrucomicrobia bacterium]|nr:MAG: D-alanyl-D-alanine carboxypeptidase [Verrucomicrobiota bacterium]
MPIRVLLALLTAFLAIPLAGLRAEFQGAIAMDAANGNILIEENPDDASPPASVVKLMTFLVVHDALASGRVQLSTPVTANSTDQSMGGTQVFLSAGETFSVEELLYATMIESANDAAHALAIPVAGSREAFVAQMNARAQGLGMKNTVFRSPHGLPPASRDLADSDISSPRDLALLARELVTHTDALRYSSVRARLFGEGVRPKPQPLRNHNKLLASVEGCDGLKTGFTRSAGFCLVATAQRGTKRVIVAVTGSPDAKTRDAHVARLIDEGFAKIPDSSVFIGGPATPVVLVVKRSPASPEAPSAPETAPEEETPTVRFVMPSK